MAEQQVSISAPNFVTAEFKIEGNAPYVQCKFSKKAREQMRATQEAGSTAKKGRKKEAKNFEQCYKDAMHVSTEGWHGIPATAFRMACIDACRMAGFQMTRAKCSIFVEPDGFDDEGTPLVKITKGKPQYHEGPVRVGQGVMDIRARPMWREGWQATVTVTFDGDQFTLADVSNLLMRAGMQVGVGEGRPFSKSSAGMGWGTFSVSA